jgi:hypothetical protein
MTARNAAEETHRRMAGGVFVAFAVMAVVAGAACREALVQLRKDIAAVLAAADAVIDLDHRLEVMARQ